MNSSEMRRQEQAARVLGAAIRKRVKRLPQRLRPEPTLLTFHEASLECGRSEESIRTLVRRRFLPVVSLDGGTLIPRSALTPYVLG